MPNFEDQLKDSLSHAYEIERELGGGGMSRVFVARDRLLGRRVVIKLLSPELTAEVNRGRFRREVQVAAQLQHPHIVPLLSAGEHDDLVYYTMPYIDGESLKSAMEKQGRLSIPDVVRVLYDVSDALSYAHGQGVIHRDIKPGNILRSGSHAVVTDFGIAKALNAAMSSQAMTSTGMAIGTPAYMAPEQLAGDPSADHRMDIYAMGLMAYELLVGQSPFAGISPQQVLAAVLTRDPKPLHEVRKDVPRKLSTIIMQCLSKMPGGRPPNAEALLDALDMIATSSGEIRTKEHKVPQRPKRTPSVPMIAAAIPVESSSGITEARPVAENPSNPSMPAPVAVPAFSQPVVSHLLSDPEVPAMAMPPQKKSRAPMYALAAVVLIALAAGAAWMSQKGGTKSPVSIEPPKTADAAEAPASVAANTVAPSAPVVIDSNAIAAAVAKRMAEAQTDKNSKTKVNADSLRKAVQKEIQDSIRKAAARAAAPAMVAANTAAPANAPATVAVAPVAAPTPAPAAAPVSSGKKRLAITTPRDMSAPGVASFTRQFVEALRVSLGESDDYDLIDQDEVRSAQARTSSRDEAAKILHPDVMVWPGYVGTGDSVQVIVTVWDMRSSSSYGIRVSSVRAVLSNPEVYLGPLVQSAMKQLNDLNKVPTIYRKQ
jgi:serine/threonine-protein kinase